MAVARRGRCPRPRQGPEALGTPSVVSVMEEGRWPSSMTDKRQRGLRGVRPRTGFGAVAPPYHRAPPKTGGSANGLGVWRTGRSLELAVMDFLPEPSALLAFTLAAVVLTITPGPDMTLFLGRTL